jgi:hypothetical protein
MATRLGGKLVKITLYKIRNNSANLIRNVNSFWIGIEGWPSKLLEELVFFLRFAFSQKAIPKTPHAPKIVKI